MCNLQFLYKLAKKYLKIDMSQVKSGNEKSGTNISAFLIMNDLKKIIQDLNFLIWCAEYIKNVCIFLIGLFILLV